MDRKLTDLWNWLRKRGRVYKHNKTVTLFLFLILFFNFSFFVFFFLKKKTDCTELNLYVYLEFSNSSPL